MALGTSLTQVSVNDGTLTKKIIDGPFAIFVNESLNALLMSAAVAPANSKYAIVAGFEPCLYVYGTATTFSADIYTSPDGVNWVKVATVTQASAYFSFGRNELHFPIYGIVVDVTAVSGGNLSLQVYAERRK